MFAVAKIFAKESLTLWNVMPIEVRKGFERSIAQSNKGLESHTKT